MLYMSRITSHDYGDVDIGELWLHLYTIACVFIYNFYCTSTSIINLIYTLSALLYGILIKLVLDSLY